MTPTGKHMKKYSIFYIVCRDDGIVSRKLQHLGYSQQETNQAILHQGITGFLKCVIDPAHSGLGTDSNNLLVGGRVRCLGTKNLNSFKALAPAPYHNLSNLLLDKDTELVFLLPFHLGF